MLIFMYFWPHCVGCGILVPQPGLTQASGSESAESQPLDHRGIPSYMLIFLLYDAYIFEMVPFHDLSL